MKLSIIVPVYNAEKTLKRCIESVRKQTFQDYELILVNDGSADVSMDIINLYCKMDSRIKGIEQENQGVSIARNKGIEQAQGDYILFIDSDDMIPENYCEEIMRSLKEHKEDVFVWTSISIQDGESFVVKRSEDTKERTRKDFIKFSQEGLLNSPCGKLYNRDLIIKNKIRFTPKKQIAEDLEFNLIYLQSIDNQVICMANNTSYIYIRQSDSLDNKYINNYWEVHKELLELMEELGHLWCIEKVDWKLYYERYWEYAQHALYNTMLLTNKMNLRQKLKYNNELLKQEQVKKAMICAKNKMRKIDYFFFKYLNFTLYYCAKLVIGRG